MKIKIIRGIYGKLENGRIHEKTSDSLPFEVETDEGDRLIRRGIAAEVNSDNIEQTVEAEEEDQCKEEEVTDFPCKGELENMKMEDLRRIAGEMGLKKNGTREQLIDRIAAEEVGIEDDEMPDLIPEEPE